MSWIRAILQAPGLSRCWGGVCGGSLTGASFPQVFPQIQRGLHCSSAAYTSSDSSLVPRPPEPSGQPPQAPAPHEELFGPAAGGAQDKAGFVRAVQSFSQRSVHKRGHVDFIYLALRKMPQFGVERDLAVYNLLLDVFPKEVFRPRNIFQRMFLHYPRQQECGLAVLEQMENHGVMPNKETEFLLLQIFGRRSYPMLKLVRMKLWFSRFRHANPFPVPAELPQDPVELARLGLRHMEPDLSSRVTVYQEPLLSSLLEKEGDVLWTLNSLGCPCSFFSPGCLQKGCPKPAPLFCPTDAFAPRPCGKPEPGRAPHTPHIVGIQSPDQQAALARHNPARPVFVEGPFSLWLRNKCVYYHILRADPLPPEDREAEEIPEEWNLYYPMQLALDYGRSGWDDYNFDIDEVEEGPVFAICMAGAHDQSTLAKWIQGLQETNPVLAQIPVVFRLTGSAGELQSPTGLEEAPPPPPENQEEDQDGQRRQRGQS